MERLRDYIGGKWVDNNTEFLPVFNPSTGEQIAEVPLTSKENLEAAFTAAHEAFKVWGKTSVGKRIDYIFKLRNALVERKEELAKLIAFDQAKHISDARGEVDRAIQITETACGIPMMMRGDKIYVNPAIDGEIAREPIGVIGGIAPFNFPALVYGWFVPFAIGCGNTIVFKASEQSPMFMQKIAEIFDQIGLPAGVFNLVNGMKDTVDAMLETDKIQGMAFVGSTKVGRIIAEGSAKTGKKAMVLAGAKNTLIVAKDANLDGFIENFLNSCYGAAGQRCMAGSNVAIEEDVYDIVVEKIIEASKKVKIGDALDESVFLGPVISAQSVKRICNYVDIGLSEGCTLLLDGRNPEMDEAHKNGYFVAPTILGDATPDMRVTKEEVFGPFVTLIKIKNVDEGIDIINNSEYGNGGTIFTESGLTAQQFLRNTNSGMLGVNVGVPASMPYLPFGGTKNSLLGAQTKAQGTDAIEFFTKRKVATVRFYGGGMADGLGSTCCITK